MIKELIRLINKQDDRLKELLSLMKKQHQMIMSKDVFGLESLVEMINGKSKEIAEVELERRNLMGNNKLSEFVSNQKDEVLERAYESIKNTLEEVQTIKETNELLLKQRIVFNNKMLEMMNPNRDIKTYNSYGNLRR